MNSLRLVSFVLGLTGLVLTGTASAHPLRDRSPHPGLGSYAVHGGSLGTGLGLGVAHFAARGGGADWRQWLTITGIGALSGIAGGTTVGFTDAGGRTAAGHYTLKSMNQGLLVGVFAGAAAGGLLWLNNGEAVQMADGAAVGGFAGSVAGLIFGTLFYDVGDNRRSSKPRFRLDVASLGQDSSPGLVASGLF